MHIARTKLVEHTVIAQKDDRGAFSWVEFDAPFHSHLVKCSLALVDKPAQPAMVKQAMFVFILELLNREATDSFFDLQRGKTRDNRAQREQKRLVRKRARAAKRERVREAAKRIEHTTARAVPEGTKCETCGRLFNSRKKFSKHGCVTKEIEEAKKQKKQDRSKRRKAAKAAARAQQEETPARLDTATGAAPAVVIETSKPSESLKPPPSPTPTNSGSGTPVTGSSGVKEQNTKVYDFGRDLKLPFETRECEDCVNQAVALKHGCWPKCADHIRYYLDVGDDTTEYDWVDDVLAATKDDPAH
ncbi:hypothetical protein EST38_g4253 [Candolleomyces aberdarensis]|uniref:Uncharacterized protein n=1 Tax=Candolleomyces aberdarensis TaxID=2316362 RepID=A0A4Q2DNJ7_9AGAR|nr:hypothetical protein EST38_g4253 [Candolleomyces aberdarensis]